jgi:hypothetical protein
MRGVTPQIFSNFDEQTVGDWNSATSSTACTTPWEPSHLARQAKAENFQISTTRLMKTEMC